MTGSDSGKAWLIDPKRFMWGACRSEIFAMTELFRRISAGFFAMMRAGRRLLCSRGYGRRRDLYNLYHLLNHLNLFGRAYLPSVTHIVRNIFHKNLKGIMAEKRLDEKIPLV